MTYATNIQICEMTQAAFQAAMRTPPQWLVGSRHDSVRQSNRLAGPGSRRS